VAGEAKGKSMTVLWSIFAVALHLIFIDVAVQVVKNVLSRLNKDRVIRYVSKNQGISLQLPVRSTRTCQQQ